MAPSEPDHGDLVPWTEKHDYQAGGWRPRRSWDVLKTSSSTPDVFEPMGKASIGPTSIPW